MMKSNTVMLPFHGQEYIVLDDDIFYKYHFCSLNGGNQNGKLERN